MARAIVWPQAAPPAGAEPADPLDGLDLAGLAAAFGPELARRMGIRVTAAAPGPAADAGVGGVEAAQAVLLGSVPLAGGDDGLSGLHVGCAPQVGAMLLERLFGARGSDAAAAGPRELLALPPGSASWAALCRTVATALGAAVGAAGHSVAGSPLLPPRALPMPEGSARLMTLDVDGAPCRLILVTERARAVSPAPAMPDPLAFRQAARTRALDLELPVALRIAERRISLEQARRLSVGDIIPIEPLAMLDVVAGGRRIARLPASRFAPTAAHAGSAPNAAKPGEEP